MTVTYPLTMPATPAFSDFAARMVGNTAVHRSPLNNAEQVLRRPGGYWEFDFTLPKMDRATAAAWQGFLAALDGVYGTFYAADPDATSPRGTISGTVTATATANALTATLSGASGTLKAGDWLQVGDELKMVTVDWTAGALDVWPAFRAAHSASDVVYSGPKGIFRLIEDGAGWSTDRLVRYGLTFSAREVIV